MADERWTNETEQMVAGWNEHYDHATKERCLTCKAWAQGLLDALADAGLLLPVGGEVREELVAESRQPSGAVARRPIAYDGPFKPGQLDEYLDWFRRNDPYATGHRVLQRTVHTGPWRPVDVEGAQP